METLFGRLPTFLSICRDFCMYCEGSSEPHRVRCARYTDNGQKARTSRLCPFQKVALEKAPSAIIMGSESHGILQEDTLEVCQDPADDDVGRHK